MDLLKDLQSFLELTYSDVKVLHFDADLDSKVFDQVAILDLDDDREPEKYFNYKKFGIAVKRKEKSEAKKVCQNIEYALNKKMGKLVPTGQVILDTIKCTKKTTFLTKAVSEDTYIFSVEFEALFKDNNLLNNII